MSTSRMFLALAPAFAALCAGASLGCGPSTTVQPDHATSSAATSTAVATATAASTATASGAATSSEAPTTASTSAPLPDEPRSKATATEAEMTAAAKGDSEFALAVFGKVKGTGNVLLSPASARIALAMTYAGAKGETASQMAKVLALPNDPKVHDALGAIVGQWQSWAGVAVPNSREAPAQPFTLRVANRLFGQKGRAFVPGYLTLLADKYAAPLEQVDFKTAPDPSRKHINQWVEDHTEKRIKDLVPPPNVTPDTRLVLVNALYFKADWAVQFEKEQTRDADFFATPTAGTKVPMMNKTSFYLYSETPDAQVLEIPYLAAPVAMTIVLPKAKDGLGKLESGLTPAALQGWTSKLESARVNVRLPKFKIESAFMLGAALRALGMTDALDPKKADFSGIDGTKELSIGEVIQKTFCAVDEKGTEAAAATAVVVRVGAAAPSGQPKDFVADHPFLFFLRDTKTGSLLFVGRLAKPE